MPSDQTEERFSKKKAKTQSKDPRERQTKFMRNREAVRNTRVLSPLTFFLILDNGLQYFVPFLRQANL